MAKTPEKPFLTDITTLRRRAREHIMQGAVTPGYTADRETVLKNAAREPEVQDLAHCLVAMGASVEGIGSDRVVVRGVDRLHAARHAVLPDRIETGTYAMAAAITGGDVELTGTRLGLLDAPVVALRAAGVQVSETENGIRVLAPYTELDEAYTRCFTP